MDQQVLRTIKNFEEQIYASPFPGLVTTVIAYVTLTVHYNVEQVLNSNMQGQSGFDKVSKYLGSIRVLDGLTEGIEHELIMVPVCYGSVNGPDLTKLAKDKGIEESLFINLHSAAIYRVYMVGFVPGFAYLGGMDPLLSAPRKDSPRAKVAAGSVGIAGQQTGIYPMTTPGGWQLIGRTPLRLFDSSKAQPALFKAGDLLKFYPISVEEFKSLSNFSDADHHC